MDGNDVNNKFIINNYNSLIIEWNTLENNFQKMFGEAGGQFSVYENSPLLSTKETVISLDYVGTSC